MKERVQSWAEPFGFDEALGSSATRFVRWAKQRVSLAGVLIDESPILLLMNHWLI